MRRRLAEGHTLIELLVACAIGLALMGLAVQLFARQVKAQREQLVEARLHQDLRAVSDLIVRGLRRAGQHGMDDANANPHRAIAVTATSVIYSHTRDALDDGVQADRERAGFRLAEGGVQALVGGLWQALTDPAVVKIVRFDVVLAHHPAPTAGACAVLIARELSVAIDGHPVADPQRVRRVRTSVAVRNDDVDASACAAARPGSRERDRG